MKSLSTDRLKPSLAVILGTRPEIIKMAPVLAALRASKLNHFVVYTGQHYSLRMGSEIYADLVTAGQLERALEEQKRRGKSLGEVLQELGMVSPEVIASKIREQQETAAA